MVDFRKGRPVVLVKDQLRALPAAELYRAVLLPIKCRKPGSQASSTGSVHAVDALPSVLPSQLQLPRVLMEPLIVSCDGSHYSRLNKSGWGFTVACNGAAHLVDFCGPTEFDANSSVFIGAQIHSNNVDELEALIFDLRWFL